MSLYKYVAPERIDILRNGFIRFAQRSALNDPLEISPIFRDVEHIIPLISDPRYAGKQIEMKATLLGAEAEPYIVKLGRGAEERERFVAHMRFLVDQVCATMGEAIGVLSLTERPDNVLMWAHYAQQHQGLVIQFDETHAFFNNRDAAGWSQVNKIAYSDERPLRASMVDLSIQEVFFTKGRDWEYEQEWRLLRLLSDCHKNFSTPAGTVHLFYVPADCITGVILGCRMIKEDRDELLSLFASDERYHHVKTYQIEIDPDKYQLNIRAAEAANQAGSA